MSLIPLGFWKNHFTFEYPPAADHGWSLVKRNPNYNGPCIRLRRTSDDTEQDFGFVNGIVDYVGIDTFMGANNVLVAKWYDQFGSYDMVPFYYTSGNSWLPALGSAGNVIFYAGMPYISFNNANAYAAMVAGVGNSLTSYLNSTVFYTYLNYSNGSTMLCGNSNGNSTTTQSFPGGTNSSSVFWDWGVNAQNYYINENLAAYANRVTSDTFVTNGDLFAVTEYLRSRNIPKLMAERGVGWNALGNGHSIGGRGNGNTNTAFPGYLNEYLIYKSTKTDAEVRSIMKTLNKVHKLYDKSLLSTDLVLHYDAANSLSYIGSGTAVNDISGNAPYGGGATLNNCTFSLNDGGKFVLQSASNSFINTTTYNNDYPWSVGGGDFSMEAWVKFTNANQQSLIWVKRNTSTGSALMLVAGTIGFNTITASKKISVFLQNQNADRWLLVETTNDIIDGNWKHIIATRSDNTLKIYVNGVNQALTQLSIQGGTSPRYVEANSSWKVGDWGGNTGGQFNGEVSILRLYISELTQEQVTRNYDLEKSRYGLGSGFISDGLLMHLDAGNTSSYPGSGTTWTDISGKSNNSTLVNGVSYSSSDGGTLVFDGINDYVTSPNNLIPWTSSQPFTVSIWFKTNSNGVLFGQQNTSTPGSAEGYVPAIYIDSNNKLRTSLFWGGDVLNQSITTVDVNDNTWKNITVTYSGNTNEGTFHRSYLNGSLYATLTKTQFNYTTTYYYFIGAGRVDGWGNPPTDGFYGGNISIVHVYSRALTSTEVLQNFNAIKSRYGL